MQLPLVLRSLVCDTSLLTPVHDAAALGAEVPCLRHFCGAPGASLTEFGEAVRVPLSFVPGQLKVAFIINWDG